MGYDARDASESGAEAGDEGIRPFEQRYRPDQARDEQGRWVDEGSGEDEDGEGGAGERELVLVQEQQPREPDEFDEDDEQDPLLHRVSRRGPGQTGNPRLDAAFRDAKQSVQQTRELDPSWQPPRSFTSRDNIEGQIAHYQAVANAARERYGEITRDAVPGVNPAWSANRLREELRNRGFEFVSPTNSPGVLL